MATPEELAAGGGAAMPEGSEPTTVVPKALLAGKEWKPGDEIVFVIKAIDPETGDAEIAYATAEAEPAEDTMAAMDERFPPEETM